MPSGRCPAPVERLRHGWQSGRKANPDDPVSAGAHPEKVGRGLRGVEHDLAVVAHLLVIDQGDPCTTASFICHGYRALAPAAKLELECDRALRQVERSSSAVVAPDALVGDIGRIWARRGRGRRGRRRIGRGQFRSLKAGHRNAVPRFPSGAVQHEVSVVGLIDAKDLDVGDGLDVEQAWQGPFRFPLDQINRIAFFQQTGRKPRIALRQRAQARQADLGAGTPVDMSAGQGTGIATPVQDTLVVGDPEMRRPLQRHDGAGQEDLLCVRHRQRHKGGDRDCQDDEALAPRPRLPHANLLRVGPARAVPRPRR